MTVSYMVQPVEKALRVLLFLGASERSLTLTEISYKMNIPKTTVFRYLQTLEAFNLVSHDEETEGYRLGLRVWELGQKVGTHMSVREAALPLMQQLRERFNETINLGVLTGQEIVYLEIVESSRALRMRAQIGGRDPVYSTSLGKAILAFLPDEVWSRHLPTRLPAQTSNTLTSLAILRKDLMLARERGYAIDKGENEDGSYCVGAPIFDHQGKVVAALSLSAPASRISDAAMLAEVSPALVGTTKAISRRLGYAVLD